ncbi:MAG: four-carbon acid sugar kinase family protein [Betaproteobacteria bacterium]|nr:four-carbon acid sugar kinase family protein [Betaproteobacteria bacterium]
MSGDRLLAFYGDDFTGSTDAMEALASAGLRTVLFLEPPDRDALAGRFADVRCVGVAGTSRAMTPAEMDAELAPVLQRLWDLGAPLLHYKVCSTFDSSPTIGNIGHVVDMARRSLNDGRTVSVLAGAPPLRRFTVFGNHFAAAGDEIFRLDRHPTMAHHPSTPMDESDLRTHLGRQTQARVNLMSLLDLEGDDARVDERFAHRMQDRPGMLLYDVLDDARLRQAGRLIWTEALRTRHFAVGSSGIGYALTAHWRETGTIGAGRAVFPSIAPVDRLLVISGSASPMTAQQIAWAAAHGFDTLRAPTEDLVQPARADAALDTLFGQALAALDRGRSVVVYSASGPDDPGIRATRDRLARGAGTAKILGAAMGRLARDLLARTGLRRVVIAGGDTSSYATQELGLYALEMLSELTPGAPLCRGHSTDSRLDGLEIALKGGQMGRADYFGRARGDAT